jgi:hypothetical protein
MNAERRFVQALAGNISGVEFDAPVSILLTRTEFVFKFTADQGYAAAEKNYRICPKHGEGISKGLTETANYFKLAANQRFDVAQFIYPATPSFRPDAHERPLRAPFREDLVLSSNLSVSDHCPTAVVHITRWSTGCMGFEGEERCARNFQFLGDDG